MKNVIEGLKPESLWEHFYQMTRIPRCSKHEEQICKYVISVAERNGFSVKTDAVNNIVVKKPATAGHENAPIAVLQNHLDMVCEKNKDTVHDFSKDPIKLLRDGDWITADGTTLGADNGIGAAAALAVMESKDIAHGPLEFLFTIDEETGLTGAIELGEDMLEGHMLLNLDSEEDGDLYIGCAGGSDTELFLDLETEPLPASDKTVRLRVGGLQGGHSGLQIDTGLGNAIKLLGRILADNADELSLRLMHIDGGSKHNAIPRECDAIVALPQENLTTLKDLAEKYESIFKEELKSVDDGVFVQVEESGFDVPNSVFAPALQRSVLNMLYAIPHGVLAMSHAVPGLVETSTNLAVIKTHDDKIGILTSQRSSVASGLDNVVNMVCSVGALANSTIKKHNGYPPWQPNPDSQLLHIAKEVYHNIFNEEVNVKAIHAGLECGLIGDKFPGMDMISFGPTILGAHSPDERVQISTVEKFWKYLVAIIEHLAK